MGQFATQNLAPVVAHCSHTISVHVLLMWYAEPAGVLGGISKCSVKQVDDVWIMVCAHCSIGGVAVHVQTKCMLQPVGGL
jgi:hypothetical protein